MRWKNAGGDAQAEIGPVADRPDAEIGPPWFQTATLGFQQRIHQRKHQHHGHAAEHTDHGAHALLDDRGFIEVIEAGEAQIDHNAQQRRKGIEGGGKQDDHDQHGNGQPQREPHHRRRRRHLP